MYLIGYIWRRWCDKKLWCGPGPGPRPGPGPEPGPRHGPGKSIKVAMRPRLCTSSSPVTSQCVTGLQLLWSIFEVQVNVRLLFSQNRFFWLLPGTHHFPTHLWAIKTICVLAQFFQIYILVWTRPISAQSLTSACTFSPQPSCFPSLLWHPFRSGLTWSQVVITLARNSPHARSALVKRKLCTAKVLKNTNPVALSAATFGSGGCFVTNRINKMSCLRNLYYNVNGEKKNSCAARLCNVGEMKSDAAGTCWSCRNLRFDNPTANILGHFTIYWNSFFCYRIGTVAFSCTRYKVALLSILQYVWTYTEHWNYSVITQQAMV